MLYIGGDRILRQKQPLGGAWICLTSGVASVIATVIVEYVTPYLFDDFHDEKRVFLGVIGIVAIYISRVGLKFDRFTDDKQDGHPYEWVKWVLWCSAVVMFAGACFI